MYSFWESVRLYIDDSSLSMLGFVNYVFNSLILVGARSIYSCDMHFHVGCQSLCTKNSHGNHQLQILDNMLVVKIVI